MMFCVSCGVETENTIHGLCLKCHLNGRKMLKFPHHVDLERCTNCEEFRIGDKWVSMSLENAVEEAALSVMSVDSDCSSLEVATNAEAQDERTYKVEVEADMTISGMVVSEIDSVLVRVKNTVCRKCSRQLGNYYEAVLQLRTGNKIFPDELRDAVVRRITKSVESQAKNNRQLFITSVKEVPGGVDVLLSNISLAKGLAKDLCDSYGAESKESSSLVGMNSDGLEIYRVTYLVRFPSYHVGDVLEKDGALCKLSAITKTGGKVIMLKDFREVSVRKSDLQDMKIIAKKNELIDAVVISKTSGEIQAMHPVSFSITDLKIPADAVIGETVKTVQGEDALYFVP